MLQVTPANERYPGSFFNNPGLPGIIAPLIRYTVPGPTAEMAVLLIQYP
jgi:hypothetical protein